MFDEKSREIGRLLFLLDICLTILVFLLSFWLRDLFFTGDPADFFPHVVLLPFILFFLSFFLFNFGVYQGLRTTSIFIYGWSLARALVIGHVILFTLLFLLKIQYVSRMIIITFASLDFVILIVTRIGIVWWYFKKFPQKKENNLKVLIIGTGERAKRLSVALCQNSEWGVDIVGHLDPDPTRVGSQVLDSQVIGTVESISSVLKNRVIDEVILSIPRNMIEDVDEIAHACEEEGVKLRLMADVFDLHVARMRLVNLGEIPLLTLEPVARNELKLIVKRLMDLILTLTTMPIFLPVMGIITLAIKIDSPGPVFFVQERVGLNKRTFHMYKFRSMYSGSEEKMKELEGMNEAEGPIFKITNDPRITKVGRFLRKTSLDELPQLFNVIRGYMSIVGPRPMSLRDVNLFDKGIQRKRFSVRPGLTCLWQISGRSNLPFSKWIELDLTYIENWSLGLDIKILLKTIPVVLKGTGAV